MKLRFLLLPIALTSGITFGATLEHEHAFHGAVATVAEGPLALFEACNASTDQIHTTEQDGFKLAGCILGAIFGGVTDPGAIAGQCSGALPSVIVDVIDDFNAKAPDAGAAELSPQGKLLADARAKAVAVMAEKAPGK
jgi:hypothetical protein